MTLRNIVRSFVLANLGALLGSEPNNGHKRFKNYSYCDSTVRVIIDLNWLTNHSFHYLLCGCTCVSSRTDFAIGW